jgi:hypothetical protein
MTGWTGVLIRDRLVEAFEIEHRIPSRSHGSTAAWPFPALHSFADHVGWPDASQRIWTKWENACSASPQEITRMDEAFAWLRDLRDHRDEQRCLARWAVARARHMPVTVMLRREPWSRTHFYRLMIRGSELVAHRLNAQMFAVTE